MRDDGPDNEAPPSGDSPPEQPKGPSGLVGSTIGRYRILAEIGRGGMGVVYRALDERLQREVALKFLPDFLSGDATAKQRFVAEARSASALDHPNICTIHEIGDVGDGGVYIAMSYYEGETLKDKLDRGPLPLSQALDYAVQIARGLSKAHAKRIVHRDIKPANVLITEDGIAKILDFGTAKVEDLNLTQTGVVLGTFAYMSPEQVEGQTVDARSDIWSLGALLYQMVSGVLPFRTGHPAATINAVLNDTPPPLRERGSVPESLSATVEKTLQKDPAQRYASADDLIASLEAVADSVGVSIRRYEGGVSGVPGGSGWTRWVPAALIAALVALLIIPTTRRALFSPLDSHDDRTYLAVIPFTPPDDVVAAGLTISLTAMVAQLGSGAEGLWVVPASEVLRAGITDARSAWASFKATTVVEGTIGPNGNITLNLIETDGSDSRLLESAQLPDHEDASFLGMTRQALGAFLATRTARTIEGPAVEASIAPAAYPFYVRALGYLERYYDRENLASAETLFRQAIAEDGAFAPARAGLCRALWELYLWDRDLAVARDAASECDQAAQLAGHDPSVLVSLGSVYLFTGRHDRATEVLEQALAIDPDNADALRGLGKVYEDLGQTEEAEEAYRSAMAIRPDLWFYNEDLGLLLLLSGRPREAVPLFERVGLLAPDNHMADVFLGVAKMQADEFAEADSILRRAIEKQPDAIAYRNLGHLYSLQLRFEEAAAVLRTGLELTETDWWSWRLLGHALHFTGDAEGAEGSWRRAVELADELLTLNPLDVNALSGLAELHAALNEPAQAQAYLDRLDTLPLKWNVIHFYKGRAHEILSQREPAFSLLETALRLQLSTHWIEQDPWLEDLRQDPRYAELLERFSEE